MKKRKKWKALRRLLLSLTIVGFLFLHFYMPRFITEIKNPLLELVRDKHLPEKKFNNTGLPGKYISFTSIDNIELSAYLTLSESDSPKGTIILLHGIRSNKESFIWLSQILAKQGYHSVALDSRAHGESEGTHCTFGVKEKQDVSALIDVLTEQENLSENIGIWGQSLGGAIGLQAMGSDQRIQFGIIESTFSDFKTITNDYFNYHAGFNIKALTDYLVYRAGKIAEFDPEDARPVKYCEKITQPTLIVHGDNDQRIDIKYGRENFSKIISSDKEFIEIKTAGHLDVWKVGGQDYLNKVLDFIDKQIK